MNYNDYLELVTKRRTIRKFKDQAVSKTDIKKIVKTGALAPSGFNSQPWEYVIVRDQAKRIELMRILQAAMKGKDLLDFEPNMSMTFATASTFIIIYGDARVREFGLPHIKADDASWMFTLNTTLAIATSQMHLAATSLDLACMWVSAVRKPGVDAYIKELLGVPEHMILFEMMAIGYPDIEPKVRKARDLDEMIHWDDAERNNYRTFEEVANYFKDK